jgi:DUF1009 family protein
MPTQAEKLGILAGEGDLSLRLINHCRDHSIPLCCVQFKHCDYDTFPNIPVLKTKIEKVGAIFDFFKKNDVTHVVMIGNLQKPSLSSLRPDMRGLKTLANIGKSYMQGDDNLLRSLRREIEKEGFQVVGIDRYLKDLTVQEGVLTKKASQQDYAPAVKEALRYGSEDRGQSILYHTDGTYSYETRDGTTALIETRAREGSVLLKMTKPQQDPDLDRPTVGFNTIQALHHKKAAGMILQADSVFVVDQSAVIDYADRHGLFIEAVYVR